MPNDHRGITLVELIIAIAISTVILGAATLFLGMAHKNYNHASAQIDLQSESQILMEQIGMWVMEGNRVEELDPSVSGVRGIAIYTIPNTPSVTNPAGAAAPEVFIGIILIACSPGGSSSNIFSMIAKGDVALSVSLTACSSIITLFTIPVIMEFATHFVDSNLDIDIHLPVGSLIMQNLVLMLLPIVAGIFTKRYRPQMAERIHKILSKTAFPALILLATIFFIQHHATITGQFGKLGLCISILILLAMGGGVVLSKSMRLNRKEQRTLIIEIGMQNAAQAIAVTSSPFVFNNDIIAIPAIIYALMMNVILLVLP